MKNLTEKIATALAVIVATAICFGAVAIIVVLVVKIVLWAF